VFVNQYEKETIDFTDAEAVKTLNKALLKHFTALIIGIFPKATFARPYPAGPIISITLPTCWPKIMG
jgi:23S rRNA (adenine1618-N6)-methyltransferase